VPAAIERWALEVLINAVDVSSSLVGEVRITAEETRSGLCELAIIPAPGALDPDDYENQPIAVSYLTRDAAGTTLTTTARFTGTIATARYDDQGLLLIEATNDLQGAIEALDRAAIDTLISSGGWSKHVFDDGADPWQYARDRLSTTPGEIHVDPAGVLEFVPWAAKATPDVTLTDADRFDNTLALRRVTRRDLISQNTINFDFRFTRLRHREIAVNFTYTPGICGYLDGEATVPQRSMIQSAADSNAWVRTSDITFTGFPATGVICTPPRGWVQDGSEFFCLGASWTAARRWAQTVTEQYAITVTAPDIETAVGVKAVSENYGIEAIFDARDYEAQVEYDAPPAGSVLAVETDDYQLDADQTTANGRTELEAAQVVAIEKAKTEILERARGNRVSVGAVFDPTITLESTVRLTTGSISAKGKVYSYREQYNLETGALDQAIELAISRHGGSGIASDDPIVAPSPPAQAAETPTPRTYAVGVEIGGVIGAPADSDALEGYVCNAYGPARTDPTNLYRERFVLNMPEIEAAARNATEATQASALEVAVPQDELTITY
jgi:hypothetical protein